MTKKVIVLGTGLVGSAIAMDMSKKYETHAVDINPDSFQQLKKHYVHTKQADLSDPETLIELVSDFDLVIGALPGHFGYKTLETIIRSGKNIVDISFMPEDFMNLDSLAKEYNVTAVVDCGVSPGMGNLILGYHNHTMEVEHFTCYVGGLPLVREWPFEYKAVFSPIDVIEEYTRPARFVKNGNIVEKEALSDIEIIHFEKVGPLEAWNSDGLRSLLKTMTIPNMIEKTLRFPGTTEYIKVLRDSGFFSYEEVDIKGHKIRPIDMTARLLFPKWQLKPGEGDFTVMQIAISGKENNQQAEYVYTLYDEFEPSSGILSMSRTTGYTCTAVADLILNDLFHKPGICPPEFIGENEKNYMCILEYLKKRNVNYKKEKK